MAYEHHTTETCEGTVCSRCKIAIDMCACNPHRRLGYRSLAERITAQGLVPETEQQKAA